MPIVGSIVFLERKPLKTQLLVARSYIVDKLKGMGVVGTPGKGVPETDTKPRLPALACPSQEPGSSTGKMGMGKEGTRCK
jgi:hypothetical protein